MPAQERDSTLSVRISPDGNVRLHWHGAFGQCHVTRNYFLEKLLEGRGDAARRCCHPFLHLINKRVPIIVEELEEGFPDFSRIPANRVVE